MKLKIVNSITELELTVAKYAPKYSHPDYNLRLSEIQRYGKPGVEFTGDRQSGSRSITLGLDISNTNDEGFDTDIKTIIEALNPDYSPIYLVDTDINRRCEIELSRMRVDSEKGNVKKNEKISLTLPMKNSVWEDLEAIEVEELAMTNGDTVNINNTGVTRAYPIITMTPSELNNEFTIYNNSTGDLFRFSSNAFTVGATLEVDSINGQVWLDDGVSRTEVSTNVANGSGLLYLQQGDNELQYESLFGTIDLTVEYRRGFPF
jgi:hypothetical protein